MVALCDRRGWACTPCDSVRAFTRLIHRTRPNAVVVRHKLMDGFSDDIISLLSAMKYLPATKILVLLGAGTLSSVEVRQLTLGADCVQRDPARADVLLAYLEKYIASARLPAGNPAAEAPVVVPFAGANLRATERLLQHSKQTIALTPREVALVEMLVYSRGEVLTYDTLYSEILGRPFRGDTSNMRVLLGKLASSLQPAGIVLRRWVDVIPKTGYRYKPPVT